MEIYEIALQFVREWQKYRVVDGMDVPFTINTAPYYVALGSADQLNLQFYQLSVKEMGRHVARYQAIDGKSPELLIEWH